jgi:hypothetical protein
LRFIKLEKDSLQLLVFTNALFANNVGRISSHVQVTRPNAVSAFRIFVEYILYAYTRINRITFTYYATCISRLLRAMPRVLGKPTLISLHLD